MDKKVFLLDKSYYSETMLLNLTEKDLEEWVAEEDYNEDYTIVKIEANGYDSAKEAFINEMPLPILMTIMWLRLAFKYKLTNPLTSINWKNLHIPNKMRTFAV